jgi:hypothetical protein
VYVLVCAVRDFNLVVDKDEFGLVDQTREPSASGRSIPLDVCPIWIWRWLDIGAIRVQSVSCIRIVWIESLLI